MNKNVSIRRATIQYVSEFMRDGKEHVKGDVIAYATVQLKEQGKSFAPNSIKRTIDTVLNDATLYVRLGLGKYQLKEAYMRTNDIVDYAVKRISNALYKAYNDINDCCEVDLKDKCKTNPNALKVNYIAA